MMAVGFLAAAFLAVGFLAAAFLAVTFLAAVAGYLILHQHVLRCPGAGSLPK
jgi:hypothetical protein